MLFRKFDFFGISGTTFELTHVSEQVWSDMQASGCMGVVEVSLILCIFVNCF